MSPPHLQTAASQNQVHLLVGLEPSPRPAWKGFTKLWSLPMGQLSGVQALRFPILMMLFPSRGLTCECLGCLSRQHSPSREENCPGLFPWDICLITLKGSERKIRVRMTTLVPTTSAGMVVWAQFDGWVCQQADPQGLPCYEVWCDRTSVQLLEMSPFPKDSSPLVLTSPRMDRYLNHRNTILFHDQASDRVCFRKTCHSVIFPS